MQADYLLIALALPITDAVANLQPASPNAITSPGPVQTHPSLFAHASSGSALIYGTLLMIIRTSDFICITNLLDVTN